MKKVILLVLILLPTIVLASGTIKEYNVNIRINNNIYEIEERIISRNVLILEKADDPDYYDINFSDNKEGDKYRFAVYPKEELVLKYKVKKEKKFEFKPIYTYGANYENAVYTIENIGDSKISLRRIFISNDFTKEKDGNTITLRLKETANNVDTLIIYNDINNKYYGLFEDGLFTTKYGTFIVIVISLFILIILLNFTITEEEPNENITFISKLLFVGALLINALSYLIAFENIKCFLISLIYMFIGFIFIKIKFTMNRKLEYTLFYLVSFLYLLSINLSTEVLFINAVKTAPCIMAYYILIKHDKF